MTQTLYTIYVIITLNTISGTKCYTINVIIMVNIKIRTILVQMVLNKIA